MHENWFRSDNNCHARYNHNIKHVNYRIVKNENRHWANTQRWNGKLHTLTWFGPFGENTEMLKHRVLGGAGDSQALTRYIFLFLSISLFFLHRTSTYMLSVALPHFANEFGVLTRNIVHSRSRSITFAIYPLTTSATHLNVLRFYSLRRFTLSD